MNSRKPKRKKVSNTGKLNKQKISDDGSDEVCSPPGV